jgi:hypothetical protein
MPARRVSVIALCGAMLGSAGVASAQASGTAATSASEPDEAVARARRHFENGVKLYRDQNYAGALAEFEAAYRLKPGAGSIQNVALSQKALFRYAEAARTLQALLTRHGAELSDAEKRTVRSTIEELESLVGTLRIKVAPDSARVTIGGRSLERAELAGLRLDVGEHTVVAEAPGYARDTITVRIAGGHEQSVDIALRPVSGFVRVTTDDPQAAIAIDSEALAFHRWNGPVPPGRHYVQVYKPGFETFEQIVHVEVGKTELIYAVVGPPVAPDEEAPAPGKPPAVKPPLRGWYGLVALSAIGLDDAPRGINIEGARQTAGSSFGVRAGYRLWTPVGVELLLEGGRHEVEGACKVEQHSACGNPPVTLNYTLDSFRVGGNVRLMSGGERLRFTSSVGVGAVRHRLELPPNDSNLQGEAKGTDPYFLLEIGIQFNFGHLLAEADLVAYIDGTRGIRGDLDTQGDRAVFGDDTGLRMLGVGLRAGWSEWQPGAKP